MKGLRLLAVILLTATAGLAHGQTTRYVTDQLEIDLRSGQSNQHRILSMLRSGTPVTVLEESRDSGWSRVRTEQGQEGWILTRFLDSTPSARDRLARAEQEVARHTAAVQQLREEQRTASSSNTDLGKRVEALTKANQEQEQELNRIRRTSASALALDDENRTLKEQFGRLERDYQMLEQQNEVLRDRRDRDWFVIGAAVILLGVVIGLIIPKIRWKRKSAWNRF